MAGRDRVVDRTDDDGSEREDAERDKDTLHRVLDESERLAGVNWQEERLAKFIMANRRIHTACLDEERRHVEQEERDVQEVEERLDFRQYRRVVLQAAHRDVNSTCAHTDRELKMPLADDHTNAERGRTACHDQP
jgi:hypothetical protein